MEKAKMTKSHLSNAPFMANFSPADVVATLVSTSNTVFDSRALRIGRELDVFFL
jgi:hypothetical protein